MISLIPSKASGPRLLLISAGILLFANSALAAEPVSDPQEQARQFILAKPNFAVVSDSSTNGIAAVPAQDNGRGDAQKQAQQFILARPNFEVTSDSKTNGIAAVAAQDNGRGDPQEQARQFILAKPNFEVTPGSKTKGGGAVAARTNRGGYSESR